MKILRQVIRNIWLEIKIWYFLILGGRSLELQSKIIEYKDPLINMELLHGDDWNELYELERGEEQVGVEGLTGGEHLHQEGQKHRPYVTEQLGKRFGR